MKVDYVRALRMGGGKARKYYGAVVEDQRSHTSGVVPYFQSLMGKRTEWLTEEWTPLEWGGSDLLLCL